MQVPFFDIKRQFNFLHDRLMPRVEEVFKSQMFILGPEVEKLEGQVKEYCGVKHAIGCASGSDALILPLMAFDLQPGDEVITTPFTFFATVSAITRCGAKPVFVDIRPDTFNIDESEVENKITDRTKVILPVHLFGQSCNMIKLNEIAKKHGIKIVEDAAQSIGASYSGKKAGFADACTLSFYPTKNLGGSGDGGMVLCDDDKLAERLKILRVHGASDKYHHKYIGMNSRLDAIQAVVLQEKLKYLDQWNARRIDNAGFYNNMIQDSILLKDNIQVPYKDPDADHIYNQYSILVKNRDAVQKFLGEQGVGSGVYYPIPLHLQECFSFLEYKVGDMPVSERISKKILSLPIFPELSLDEKNYTISKLEEYFKTN